MSQSESQYPADDASTVPIESTTPKHYTRQPLWVVPLGGAVVALLPLVMYGKFRRAMPDVGLAQAMAGAGFLGMLGASILVAHSHVRSVVWANVILWGGIVLAAFAASILLSMLAM